MGNNRDEGDMNVKVVGAEYMKEKVEIGHKKREIGITEDM